MGSAYVFFVFSLVGMVVWVSWNLWTNGTDPITAWAKGLVWGEEGAPGSPEAMAELKAMLMILFVWSPVWGVFLLSFSEIEWWRSLVSAEDAHGYIMYVFSFLFFFWCISGGVPCGVVLFYLNSLFFLSIVLMMVRAVWKGLKEAVNMLKENWVSVKLWCLALFMSSSLWVSVLFEWVVPVWFPGDDWGVALGKSLTSLSWVDMVWYAGVGASAWAGCLYLFSSPERSKRIYSEEDMDALGEVVFSVPWYLLRGVSVVVLRGMEKVIKMYPFSALVSLLKVYWKEILVFLLVLALVSVCGGGGWYWISSGLEVQGVWEEVLGPLFCLGGVGWS